MKKIKQFNRFLLVGLFLLLSAVGNMAFGALRIASVSGNWSNPATWGGMAIPTNSDDIVINSGIIVTMDVAGTCQTITDMAGGMITGPGSLIIAGNAGVAITDISGTATVSCPVILPADASITVSLTLTISGIISGAAINLSKEGAGKLILSGENLYDGLTTVNAGILNLQDGHGAGSAVNGIIVNNPGQLELQSTFMLINESLSLSGTGVTGGALYNVSGTNVWFGPVVIDGVDTRIYSEVGELLIFNTLDLKNNILTVQGTSNTFIAGEVSHAGTGSIIKEGSGDLSFSSQVVSIYSLTLNDGSLISTADVLNLTGDFNNNGGIFDPNGGTINIDGGSVQNIGGTQSTTFNDLNINNSSGAILGNSEFINGVLTLTSGILTLGTNNLTLGLAPIAGSPSVSNMIVTDGSGECRRTFTTNDSYVFPVGDNTGIPEYSPVTLNFTSGAYSAGAFAGVRVIDGIHPDNASTTDYLTRYWSVTQSGITSFTYDIEGTFTNSTDDVSGDIGNITTALWTGSLWQNYNPVTAPVISVTGVSNTGDFTGISLSNSPLPTITLGANPSVCNGLVTATLPYVSTTNSPDQYAIVWSAAALSAGFSNVAFITLPVSPANIDIPAGVAPDTYTGIIFVSNSITGNSSSGTTFTITINSVPTVTIASQTNVNCFGDNTGSIDLTITDGTPSYTYSWTKDGSAFAPIIKDLSGIDAGVYEVTVNDNNGCSNTQTATITQPDAYGIDLTPTNATCFGGSKSISAAITGTPLSDFQINIDGGSFDAVAASQVVFNSLSTGNHTIILRRISDTSCMVTNNAIVTEPDALDLILTPTNATCFGGNKSISAAVTSMLLSDLQINIDGGAFAAVVASPVLFNGLSVGNHAIILRRISDTSCLVSTNETVLEPDALGLVLTPTNATCFGGNKSILAAVTGTPLSDLQINIDGGSFAAVAVSPVVFNALSAGSHTIILRRISDTSCLVSTNETVIEPDALDLVLTPTNATCFGGNKSILAAVTGTPLSDLQINIDGGTFAAVAASPVVFNGLSVGNHTIILRRISDNSCVVSKNMNVSEPAILTAGSIAADQSICYNTIPSALTELTPAMGGAGSYNYQWQSSLSGGVPWIDISGANLSTYSPGQLNSTIWYRRAVISGSCGIAYSVSVKITVYGMLNGGSIESDQAICYNSMPNEFTDQITPSGATVLNYQWQQKAGAGLWTNISGATSLTYAVTTNLTQTTFYRRVTTFASTCGITYSNEVTVTVYPGVTAGNIGKSQTICYNTIPATLTELNSPTGGTGSYTYQWQRSPNNFAWSSILGATSATYSPGSLLANAYFRRVVVSGSCGTASSFSILISVRPNITAPVASGSKTICYNTAPSQLSASAASGGSGTFTYQWQSSSDNSVWTNIPVETNYNSYTPPVLTSTSYYRLIAFATGTPACGTATSNVITITVLPEIISPVAIADQTICYNTVPLELSSTKASGGNNSFVYQWFSSINNLSWSTISGATGLTYQPAALTTTTYYHVIASATGTPLCGSVTSNSVTISVNPNITPGTIGNTQTICYNTIPTKLKGVAPATGGTGSYTYQWQSSPDNSSWTNILDSTSATYSPGLLLVNSYYRRVVSSGNCGSAYSAGILITVLSNPTAPVASANRTVCYNTVPAALSATTAAGGNGLFTYQWQSSPDNLAWTNITGATNYSTYSPPAIKSTSYYRLLAIATGTPTCGIVISNVITISVLPELISPVVSTNQIICYNTSPLQLTSTTATGGNNSFIYQWFSSLNNVSWSYISGATGLTYQAPTLAASTYYHVIATATGTPSCGSQTSNSILVTVNPNITSGTIGDAQTICYNTSPTKLTELASATGGTGSYSYQWQSSPNNFTWTNISDSTAATYSPGPLLVSTYFRRVVSSGSCGTAYSSGILITVRPNSTAPVASGSRTICFNTAPGSITATAASGGSGTFTYQWQSSPDNSVWTNISGATNYNSYSAPALTITSYYRLVASATGTPSCGLVNSNVITITVLPGLKAPVASSDQTICYNTVPLLLTSTPASGGSGTFNYQWYSSLNNSTWSFISGATGLMFQPPSLSSTTYYHIIATATGSTSCGSQTSNPIIITVNPPVTPGIIGTTQTICYNTIPARLTELVSASGGTGSYSYQWQSSSNNFSWTDIHDSVSATYSPAALLANTYYRRIVTSGSCGTAYSFSVLIIVRPGLSAPVVASDRTICYNTVPAALSASTATGGSGSFAYQWQSSPDNSVWTTITGATNYSSYSPPALTSLSYYRLAAIAAGTPSCGSIYSNVVTITVLPELISPVVSADQTICYNSAPLQLTSTAASGGNNSFTYQWYSSLNNISWSGVSGANGIAYQPSALTASTYYRVIATAAGTPSCGNKTGNSVLVAVYPNTTVIATPAAQTICSGTATGISLTSIAPGTTFDWTVVQSGVSGASAGSGSSISQVLAVAGTTSGTATYTITPKANGCAGTPRTVVITVNPVPQIAATPAPHTICSATVTSISLSSNLPSTSYAWTVVQSGVTGAYSGTGTTISQTLSATGLTAGTASYTITPTLNSCAGIPLVVVITVNPTPVATAAPTAQTICSETEPSIALTSNISGTSYNWTAIQSDVTGASAGSGILINQTLTATAVTAGTVIYSITPKASSCSGAVKTVVITVRPKPVVTATPPSQIICSGTTTSIAFTSNISGTTYSWTTVVVPSGSISGAITGSGNSIAQTLTNSTLSQATVNYTITPAAGSCAGDPLVVAVTVNPVSALSSPLTALLCSNALFNYVPTSATPTTTFSWTRGAVLGINPAMSSGTGDISETLVNTTGISKLVTYKYSLSSYSCTTIQNVIVTVSPTPILLSSLSPPPICSNTTFNYTAISSISGTTVIWSRAMIAGISNLAAIGSGNISETLINTTSSDAVVSYVYSLTLSGCTSTATINVTVKPTPTVNKPSDMVFCNGDIVPAVAFTGSVTGTTFSWGNNNTNIGLGATGVGNIPSFTSINNTSAKLNAIISVRPNANGCIGANSVFTISVDPTSNGGIVNSDASVCSGANAGTLTLSGHIGNIVKWQSSVDAGVNWNDISNTTSTQNYTNLIVTTKYRAVLQSGICGSVYSSVATITVNQASVGGAVAADASVCSGTNNGTLTLSGQNGAVAKWQSSVNGGVSWNDINNISAFQSYTNLINTTQYRSVVQNGACAAANSAIATITVYPVSIGGTVSGGATVCSGVNNTTLTLIGFTGSVTKWQSSAIADFSSGVTDIVNSTSTLTVTNLITTTFYRVVVASGVCSTVFSVPALVTVNLLPVATAGGSQAICITGTAIVAGATALNGVISWTENGAGTITSGSNTIAPTYTPVPGDAGNTVTLTMTVTSDNVCAPRTAAATYTVLVDALPTATAGGTQTICSNGTATISGASATNGAILWTENGAGSITSGVTTLTPVYTAAPADAGTTVTLTMTVISNNSCSPHTATATHTIIVNPLPTANAGGSQSICPTESVTVSGASATNGTILWTENGAGSITSGSTTLTPTYTSAAADGGTTVILTMTVTSNNACAPQTATATYTVIINPSSKGGSISGGAAVCSGSNNTILTLNGYAGSIIKWQSTPVVGFGSGVIDIANTTNNLTITDLFTTTYYRAVVQNGTCALSYSSSATITVNPTPDVVIHNPVPVCAPGTVNLTLPEVKAGSTPGLTYTYYADPAATVVYPNPATATDDIYYIKGANVAGCYDIEPVTASVYSTLGIPVFAMGAASDICNGVGAVTFNSTATNALTLSYSLDAASLLAGNTINSATGLVTFASGYVGITKITATATGCGSPATAIHSVTVNPSPTVSLVASPTTAICEGSSVTLTASNSGGGELQTYSGTSGDINMNITDNSKAAYTYPTLTLSGSGGGFLTSSDILMVTLNINHPSDRDLDIFLVDPSGTRALLLSSDNGGTADNYSNTVIRTDATIPIIGKPAPFTGTFLPEGSFTTAPIRTGAAGGGGNTYNAVVPANALNYDFGAPIDGSWSLRVFDDNGGNTGKLVNWSLAIIRQIPAVYNSVVNGPPAIGPVSYTGANNIKATAVVTPPAGSNVYTVTTTGSNGCPATSNAVTVVVKPLPIPTITADYCAYRPKVRLTTGVYSSYLWNTGAITQFIDVDIAGKYTVTVTSNGCTETASIQVADELVTNGDFSAGNTGFVTPGCPQCYKYVADNPTIFNELNPEGFYGVGADAQNYHTNFWGPGRGGVGDNFMIVNGFPGTPQPVVWQETITGLTVGTTYYFAAWARSVNSAGNGANLKFSINGVQIGVPTGALPNVPQNNAGPFPWTRFYGNWPANSTTAVLEIVDLTFATGGNDFGIDDISFGTLASIPFAFTASNNSPICSRDSLQLSSTVSGGRMPIVYSWSGPNGFTSNVANPVISNIAPNNGGTYSLSVVDYYNCLVPPVTTIVTLNPTPEIPNQSALICSGALFNATPVNGVPNASTFVPVGTTYSWSAPAISPAGSVTGTSTQTSQTSITQLLTNITNLPATVTYTVIPVSGICTGKSFTVKITVNPVVTANAGVNLQICTGKTAQLNGSVGGAATSGSWTGGTGNFNPDRNTLNAVYTPSAAEITAGTLTLTLTSNDADGAGPCSAATSTIVITINALPVLSSSVVNVKCHGASTGSVDLNVSGGTPAYNYLWTSGNGGIVPSGQAHNEDISGLVAGSYTVAVSDAKTCGASLSVILTEPTLLVAHESHTTVPCAIGATTVTITGSGGTAPYTGTGSFAQFAGTTVYTIADAKGCDATVSATVIADPNSVPVITTCPVTRNFNGCSTADISGPAFSTIVANSTYTEFSNANNKGVATDNCAVTTVTYQDVAVSGCPVVVTRTWTAGDAAGLTTTCQQILKINDVVAPSWTNATDALNITVECSDASGLSAAMALFPTASDACDPDVSNIIKTTGAFAASAGCLQGGTYTNSWKVTDDCGNTSAVYTQVITVTDNTAPIWVTTAGSLDRTAECSNIAAINAAQALRPGASDLCDANVTNVVIVAGVFVSGSICTNAGTYTNTYTVADDCGNVSAIFTQVITLIDNTAPVWITAPGQINRTVSCSDLMGLADAQALNPVAFDNCDADVSDIIKTIGLFVPSAGCEQEGKYTNTWIVADACGNTSAVYTQVITIVDNAGPTILCPASNALSCETPSFDPSAIGTASVIDNCDPNPSLTWSDAIIPGGCPGNYEIDRTWTAIDACGKSNTCIQSVFVQDVTAPVISSPVSGNLDVNPSPVINYITPGTAWDATATDNCSGVTLSAKLTGATTSGPYSSLMGVTFNEGVTTVTWTATDGCGISSSAQYTITVILAPVISCPAAITKNTDLDVCHATLNPGFPTLAIGTVPVAYTWSMTGANSGSGSGPIGYYTFNKGVTEITWTATNAAGSDVCTQTIKVIDNQPPAFSIPADLMYCVLQIFTAEYFNPTMDITPVRPDYYVFKAGNTDLDLDPSTFSDNCPISCIFEIRWRIDFEDGTSLPALPATYITGQPSAYSLDIQFPGDAISNVFHHITYQVVDCSGNVSAPQVRKITIDPRPNVTKVNSP